MNDQKPLPFIETERLILRMGQIEDIPAILEFCTANINHLQRWEPRRPEAFRTREFWEKQIPFRLNEYAEDRSLPLFVFMKSAPSEIAGNTNFSNFVRGAGQMCNLGYALAEAKQGQGIMREAVTAAVDYVFKNMNMHRIMANYMPENERSGNLLKKLGFTIEGNAKEYLLIDGKWRDHVLTSLTNPNWQQP